MSAASPADLQLAVKGLRAARTHLRRVAMWIFENKHFDREIAGEVLDQAEEQIVAAVALLENRTP